MTQLLVRITPPGGDATIWLVHRASIDQCGPAFNGLAPDGSSVAGGFYFDRDPNGPVPPGRIILCPAICALELQIETISVACPERPSQGVGGMRR